MNPVYGEEVNSFMICTHVHRKGFYEYKEKVPGMGYGAGAMYDSAADGYAAGGGIDYRYGYDGGGDDHGFRRFVYSDVSDGA